MKSVLTGLCISTAALCILIFPQVSADAVSEGLKICASGILPSLFPFFLISNLLTSLGYTNTLSRLMQPLMKRLFHLPGAAAATLITGLLGGYPVGAQTAASLYKQNILTKDTAERVLSFCSNAGPSFIFGIVGAGIFQSVSIGVVLYLFHILSAITTGLLLRPNKISFQSDCPHSRDRTPFLQIFPDAVRKAGETTFQVCVFVVLFRIATAFLSFLVPDYRNWHTVVLGSIELAGGAEVLRVSGASLGWKFCVVSGLLGWGGLCVHCQTLSILSQAGLSAKRYLLGKILQACISVLLAMVSTRFLPLPIACTSRINIASPVFHCIPTLCVLAALITLLKITSGKVTSNRL